MIRQWPRTQASAVLILMLSLIWLAQEGTPAQAAPPTLACERLDQLRNGGALLTDHVVRLATHHCRENPNAAERAKLRPRNEWAASPGYLCDRLSHVNFAVPGMPDEKREAQCVTSWVEYSLYAQAHPKCLDDINRVTQNLNLTNQERPDIWSICPDPAFGEPTADKKKPPHHGGTGIAGWLCVAVVIFAVAIGGKFSRA